MQTKTTKPIDTRQSTEKKSIKKTKNKNPKNFLNSKTKNKNGEK